MLVSMELPEDVKIINKRLIDYFGKFEDGSANFRVIWSDNEIEKRFVYETAEGFHLLTPILAELPKYSYIRNRFILERIVPVPESAKKELLDRKLSYEPIWVFEDGNHEALPPDWDVINILVRTLLDQATYTHKPIKQAEGEGNTLEEIEYRESKLREALFGNETDITDALSHGSAVGYGTKRPDFSRFDHNPLKIH